MPVMRTRSQKLLSSNAFILAVLTLILILIAIIPARTAYSQDQPVGDPLRGGRLYAAWDNLAGTDLPQDFHPLWPVNTAGAFPVRFTWRCVNCHGWDYMGSHSRNFLTALRVMQYPDMFGMVNQPAEDILPLLTGKITSEHDFSAYLDEQDLLDLSAFLSSGLTLPDLVADWETFQVQGTLQTGEQYFGQFCASCHGFEGEKINLNTAQNPLFLGDMAWTNPWRIAHIIRFGHLNTRVPPAEMLQISFSQQIDILAYTQTLPNALQIIAPEFQAIDFNLQAPTEPLTFGALAVGGLILVAAWIVLRRQK